MGDKILVVGDSVEEELLTGIIDRVENNIPVMKEWVTEIKETKTKLVSEFLTDLGYTVDYVTSRGKVQRKVLNNKTGEIMHLILEYEREEYTSIYKVVKEKFLLPYKVVVIVDYGLGSITDDVIKYIIREHQNVFVKTGRQNLKIFKNATVIMSEEDIFDLRSKHDGDLIVTRGGKPVILNAEEEFPIEEIVRPTSQINKAEVFLSVLVGAYVKSLDLGRAIKIANLAASKACKTPGFTNGIKWEDFLVVTKSWGFNL